MFSFHLNDLHVPRKPNLFVAASGIFTCFSIALLAFVISWMVGGTEYKALLGGNVTLVVLIAGLVLSGVFALIEKPKD